MNYSLNRETLECLMALVMVTKRDWQPARTHKQKHHDLGQDCASSAGYITLPPWSKSDMLFCKAYVNCVPGREAFALKCDFNQHRCLDPCVYCKSPSGLLKTTENPVHFSWKQRASQSFLAGCQGLLLPLSVCRHTWVTLTGHWTITAAERSPEYGPNSPRSEGWASSNPA